MTNVFCWKPSPGTDWMVHEASSGITCIAPSREAAVDDFQKIWNFRSPLEWKNTAPPPRPGQRPESAPVIENLTEREREERVSKVFRKWAAKLHPDVCRSVKPHDAMLAITELYEAATTR